MWKHLTGTRYLLCFTNYHKQRLISSLLQICSMGPPTGFMWALSFRHSLFWHFLLIILINPAQNHCIFLAFCCSCLCAQPSNWVPASNLVYCTLWCIWSPVTLWSSVYMCGFLFCLLLHMKTRCTLLSVVSLCSPDPLVAVGRQKIPPSHLTWNASPARQPFYGIL